MARIYILWMISGPTAVNLQANTVSLTNCMMGLYTHILRPTAVDGQVSLTCCFYMYSQIYMYYLIDYLVVVLSS